jgi:hypothetical protein
MPNAEGENLTNAEALLLHANFNDIHNGSDIP